METETSHFTSITSMQQIYQMTFDRNEKFTTFIRITDGAIFGFLGIAFIELFKDNLDLLPVKILIFSILVVISMTLWRVQVRKYQDDIELGYKTLLFCEHELDIPDDISLKNKIIKQKFPELLNEIDGDKRFYKLIEKFDSHQYTDDNHKLLDQYALFIRTIGIIISIVDVFFLVFLTDTNYVNYCVQCCDVYLRPICCYHL
jgi:hypothetical protein